MPVKITGMARKIRKETQKKKTRGKSKDDINLE